MVECVPEFVCAGFQFAFDAILLGNVKGKFFEVATGESGLFGRDPGSLFDHSVSEQTKRPDRQQKEQNSKTELVGAGGRNE
jgi:hypothetical protein